MIGGKNHTLLRNLLSPEKPSAKTLAELTAVLKRHFAPKRVVIAERFRFYRREQNIGESVADYEAELRRLATLCDFGEYLDQALRDRLVCGLRSEATQEHLLSKSDLTLKRALEIPIGGITEEIWGMQFSKRGWTQCTISRLLYISTRMLYHAFTDQDQFHFYSTG